MANCKQRSELNKKLGAGARLIDRLGLFSYHPYKLYRIYVAVLTFICYAAYHMSRKPFSVVANVLAPNCSLIVEGQENESNHIYSISAIYTNGKYHNSQGWPPFNGPRCKTLIGAVDYSWLFTYAIFLIASGYIADRVSVRYFLTLGMFGSGVFVGLLGVAYYAEVHHIAYFIVVQIFVGIFESTGWPGVVAVMGNWFGKKNRGLFLGIWNAHTSVGNILGTAVPSIWAVPGQAWGWSFLVPAFVMVLVGIMMFLFLVVDPSHVGLPPPQHHLDEKHNSQAKTQFCDQNEYGTRLNVSIDNNVISRQGEHETSISEKYFPDKENASKLANNNDVDSNHSEELRSKSQSKNDVDKSDTNMRQKGNRSAISLIQAFKVPGVLEFSVALFFAKLVAYTFLFWLPYYIAFNPISGKYIGEQKADLLATLYDVGGIIGGIITGAMSDLLSARATSSVIMMYLAVPTLFLYRSFGHSSQELSAVLIIFCGAFINGPYALITTAVSNDLGTHKSLGNNLKAKATVGAIIDGFGSLGAATGPLITGWVSDDFGWDHAFYVLMASCFISSLMLTRLLLCELKYFCLKLRERSSDYHQLLIPGG